MKESKPKGAVLLTPWVHSRWYSQCVPFTIDDPITDSPDSPIATHTFETTITINDPAPSAPSVVTTFITYLTPDPTPEPTQGGEATIIIIDGQTFTLVPDNPTTPAPIPRREISPAPVSPRAPTPTQLQSGQYWIRAVAAPNFHKYLQTDPANTPGPAKLLSSRTAGQFSIQDGQLVGYAGEGGKPLYMNVEKPADLTQRKLATWFNETKNEFGTFVFQGDALTWSTPEVKRENLAAWLACENHELFINTGAYAYQTPAGCSDQTVSHPREPFCSIVSGTV